MTGVDPSEDAIAQAAANAPAASFRVAWAEDLPFEDHSFDGAVFLNSLHHIPGMRDALSEAARVVGASGSVVVVEPLPSGSFFAAFLPVEDERAVRSEAQRMIDLAVVAEGVFRLVRTVEYDRRETFADLDQFLERV